MRNNDRRDESLLSGASGDRMIASLNRNAGTVLTLFADTGTAVKIAPRGCGVLIQINSVYFVFTAAHVIEAIGRHGVSAAVVEEPRLLPLHGQVALSAPPDGQPNGPRLYAGRHGADIYDVAVMRLTLPIPPTIASRALTLADLDRGPASALAGAIGTGGWPANRVRVDPKTLMVNAKWTRYFGREVPEMVYPSYERKPLHHLLVQWDKRTMMRDGVWSDPPALSGVSGAGMWRMESRKSALIVGQRDKMTAIFTGRLRGKPDVLVGTRIGHHLRLIQRAWPDVGAG